MDCDVAELSQPRAATTSGGRVVGLLVKGRWFFVMHVATYHRSEGAENVSGETPPMLKSGKMREQKESEGIYLIKVKSLGSRKFYLSHKGDLRFIGGNPSSHKGWVSRFFYVKWVGRKRNPWRCDISWRDNVYTLTPSTPDLTTFFAALCEKCYSAPELVKEDLLCHLGFSRKEVQLVKDLAERMDKVALLKALKEHPVEGSSRAAVPPIVKKGKRKALQSIEKEVRRQKKKGCLQFPGANHPHYRDELSADAPGPDTRGAAYPDAARNDAPDSLVVSPSRSTTTGLLCNMAPDRDLHLMRNAPNIENVGDFTTQFAAAMAWDGEVINRLTRARREATSARQSFDEAQREALEAQGKKLTTEKAAVAIEKEALAAEKRTVEAELEALEAGRRHLRNTVTLYHNDIDRRISQLVEVKKEHKSTQVALEASHLTISGLTEIGLCMSKKIERMKAKKQQDRESHMECHHKLQARIQEAEDTIQEQHLIIEALVEEKSSLLQIIQGLQEDHGAPAPFDDEWEEEPEEDLEEEGLEDIPLGEGEIVEE
ncbi:hypothetical protein F511_29338 [Dorcoceras hygrometricum]|uniref:Uncharacterized protein n=1 Tax=Dorcoceras hygrometricum TaxID=472368 RepID=A0A2Z7AYZ1_9LAMI|nr:hypothetical protein F511_29338 [Dorcoceras hygrometricum]